jgi:hypothetical protein
MCALAREARTHANFASRNDTYRFKQREAIRQRLLVLTEDTRFVGSHTCAFCVYISLGVCMGKFNQPALLLCVNLISQVKVSQRSRGFAPSQSFLGPFAVTRTALYFEEHGTVDNVGRGRCKGRSCRPSCCPRNCHDGHGRGFPTRGVGAHAALAPAAVIRVLQGSADTSCCPGTLPSYGASSVARTSDRGHVAEV